MIQKIVPFKILILFLVFTASKLQATLFSGQYCTIFESTNDHIHCTHQETGEFFHVVIPPFGQNSLVEEMKMQGASFVNNEEYGAYASIGGLTQILNLAKNQNQDNCNGSLQKAAYRPDQINKKNKYQDEAIDALNQLASELKTAGLCDVRVKLNAKFGILDHNTLLEHFLCLANYESALGKKNYTRLYRGPYMISKEHGGKNKICSDLDYFKDKSKDYETSPQTRIDNAKCAVRLYVRDGLNPWGAHRRCHIKRKKQFDFLKKLNPDFLCKTIAI